MQLSEFQLDCINMFHKFDYLIQLLKSLNLTQGKWSDEAISNVELTSFKLI